MPTASYAHRRFSYTGLHGNLARALGRRRAGCCLFQCLVAAAVNWRCCFHHLRPAIWAVPLTPIAGDRTCYAGSCLCGAITFHGGMAQPVILRAAICTPVPQNSQGILGSCSSHGMTHWSITGHATLRTPFQPTAQTRILATTCGSFLFWKERGGTHDTGIAPRCALACVPNQDLRLRSRPHLHCFTKVINYDHLRTLVPQRGARKHVMIFPDKQPVW